MKGGRFSPGQAYVAFSRVKQLHDLYILNFNAKAIKSSSDVQNEMARLKNRLLRTIPQLQFLPFIDIYVTICLLNVRSLVAKLADIEQDKFLKAANVVCFCETWLTQSQPSPSILNDQETIRCDRQANNNKGGTMICVSRCMQPSQTCTLNIAYDIEVAYSTLTLPDANQIQIFVLYRSPNVPLQSLLTTMYQIVMYASTSNIPTIILGDFNVDLLSQPNSSILTLMSNHGYTQLVTNPTTANGTLIDHIYYNRPTTDIIVQVHDAYYSDHDTVYCSIPIL